MKIKATLSFGVILCILSLCVYALKSRVKIEHKEINRSIFTNTLKTENRSNESTNKYIHANVIPNLRAKIDRKKLFPEITTLNKDERERFSIVPRQIVKFFDWGKMDDAEVENFRQTVWEMGDRGIATIAEELNSISSSEKISKEDAKRSISNLDSLRYFASAKWPIALSAINKLAKRPVLWDATGRLQDPANAGVTFEAFEILSSTKKSEAEEYILGLDDENQLAYIYHYIIGRKIAGDLQTQAVKNAKEVFGSEKTDLAMKTARES